MPELPEVQTTVAGLQYHATSATITEAVFHRDTIRYPLESAWLTKIRGRRIVDIRRRAKLIIMTLDEGYLLWHLGMTGSLRISQDGEEKRKHDHVELRLTDGRSVRFHDPRRFGYLKWLANESELLSSFSHYGVEPLDAGFNSDFLYQRSRGKQQAVKNFIMNQTVVVGVGNIYACEALFMAGILPQTACGKISKARYQRLVEAIQKVLKQAINQGGTTLKDFINADAKPGYFQQSLLVYGCKGQACKHCGTAIASLTIGGRNSFYCPNCQR